MTEPGTQRAEEGGEPRVLTIPSGCAFLPTLVDALSQGEVVPGLTLDSPLWADATIYLPTQRAARAFAALLAERSTSRAALLPRIVPLGETDDAEFELATGAFEDPGTLRPPIPPQERRLILTETALSWARKIKMKVLEADPDALFQVPSSPADAVRLAGDLERLMDALTREDVPWEELTTAVETEYSQYFGLTLSFLNYAADEWNDKLAKRDASDPAKRQADLIGAEARRLLRDRPGAPIIAAGSTGSVPATAGLLAAIARMPRGAVVLPGLDLSLDEGSWAAIGAAGAEAHGHPQAVMRSLLSRALQAARAEVRTVGAESPGAAARARLLSEALRPAETTDLWAAILPTERARLAEEGARGLTIVEAADEREEALVIALALREVLEEPSRTAALVTPDRGLAVRVAAELKRWGVEVDDSAGTPLPATPSGRLALLSAEAAAESFHPRSVIALLAHPHLRLGLPREAVERGASAIEIGVFRGPAPAPGLAGLRAALRLAKAETGPRSPLPRRRLCDEDWALAEDLIARLEEAFATLADAEEEGLVAVAEGHARVLRALRRPPEGEEILEGPDGEALAALFDDLAVAERGALGGRLADYPSFLAALAEPVAVRCGPRAGHRRVKILGLLEARLLTVDRMVLGGLDEGVWPPATRTDAFLNRPMRAKLSLSAPERRIGQTAHDLVQALGCPDAVITRARKRDSSPLVPSRFLQRLKAFVGEARWRELIRAGERLRRLAAAIDLGEPSEPVARPAPRPQPPRFPRSLSVTEVETLVRDPYAVFARHVLQLEPLDPVALIPSAAERGTLIHQVLAEFARLAPEAFPPTARDTLMRLGAEAFAPLAEPYPELHAEWWPRFTRIAKPFLAWEEERRPGLRRVHAEIRGAWSFPLPTGEAFLLRARADRIEEGRGGGHTLIDFKTGQPPSSKEVFAGFAPQLTLQAAMLRRGAFPEAGRADAAPHLLYVQVAGGRKPFERKEIKPPKDGPSLEETIERHERAFQALVADYAVGRRAYLSRPYPKFAKRFSPYDHLARVKEWSLASAGSGEEAA